jgi:hypothetical protein
MGDIGGEAEALQTWASGHGLAWQPEDTLPPVTPRLRLGVGVGEHRSSTRTVTDRGMTVIGNSKKRPERQTIGVVQGRLPGGLEGRIGHHVHLTDRGPYGGDDRYLADTDTVVFAELPFRARPVFHLEGGKGGGEVKAAITIGKAKEMKSPLEGVLLAPHGKTESGGLVWDSFPAESDERIRGIVSASTRTLDGLPWERTAVEYECGRLAVWIKGRALTDPAQLDALCRFASGLAEGLGEVDRSTPPLELDQALPIPEPDKRQEWIADGVGLVEWDEPPVSVIAAQERYKKDVSPQATRTGWKVYGIVAVSLFIFSLLVAAASLGLSLAFDQYPMPIAIVVAVISVGLGAIAANRVGFETGQEALEDRLNSSAVPWGIEAFARGYAEHAGLTREDHEELRRRLEVPFRGRCQIAWQGELCPGRPGHLSVWIDATDTPQPPRFYLLAVTGAPGNEVPTGYQSLERNRERLVWQEVTSVQRAIHRLDQLRQAAAG